MLNTLCIAGWVNVWFVIDEEVFSVILLGTNWLYKVSEIHFLEGSVEDHELTLPRNLRNKLTTHSDTRAKEFSA